MACLADPGTFGLRMSEPVSALPLPEIEALGEAALLVRFGHKLDAAFNAQALALADSLRRQPIAGIRDVLPAYASVAVYFDEATLNEREGSERIATALERRLRQLGPTAAAISARRWRIPVVYGGDYGPDLARVARFCGCTAEEVIARHQAAEYRVAMLGFQPGFAYLIGLDPGLATPRLDAPRQRVWPGSVGIGGAQTGIYPGSSPGGWNLIGRTPCTLFDPHDARPALLQPGDRLRFVAIAADAYEQAQAVAES